MVTLWASVTVTPPAAAVNLTDPAPDAVNVVVYSPAPLSMRSPNVPVPVLPPASPKVTGTPRIGFPDESFGENPTVIIVPGATLVPSASETTDDWAASTWVT